MFGKYPKNKQKNRENGEFNEVYAGPERMGFRSQDGSEPVDIEAPEIETVSEEQNAFRAVYAAPAVPEAPIMVCVYAGPEMMGKKPPAVIFPDRDRKFCPNCGMPAEKDAKFCSECGKRLITDEV